MKKITLIAIAALGLSSVSGLSAQANDSAGIHVSHESGVKVYRGSALHVNHQAAATFKALELKERQIKNQNLQAQRRLNLDNRIAQQRLDLDRRIAFTDNEIFTNRRGRFNNRRFVTGRFNNRFFGINGISRNTSVSKGYGTR